MFSNPWYIVHEDEGPLKAKLVLTKSATENVTIQVTATSRTATGESCSYCVYIQILWGHSLLRHDSIILHAQPWS